MTNAARGGVQASGAKKKHTMNGHWKVVVAACVGAIFSFLVTRAVSPTVSPQEMRAAIAKANLDWKDALSSLKQQQKESAAAIAREVDKLHPIIDSLRESINKDTNDRIARLEVQVEFCVQELRKGGRFTQHDGARLEAKLDHHMDLGAHQAAHERITDLEERMDRYERSK